MIWPKSIIVGVKRVDLVYSVYFYGHHVWNLKSADEFENDDMEPSKCYFYIATLYSFLETWKNQAIF